MTDFNGPGNKNASPLDNVRPGMRVVVRYHIEEGLTDALGNVVSMDDATVTVETRRGVVKIDRTAVVAAKEVPPKPSRRGAPHLAISMEDLERVMVAGWQPLETAELGGWLLRAGAGFTGRANSVLPLGNPGIPQSDAVDHCGRWYDERQLRRLFALFGPAGFSVDQDPLGRELVGRGYELFNSTRVLTAATTTLPAEVPHTSGARVRLEPRLSPAWWAVSAERSRVGADDAAADAARAVMTGSADQLFASLEVDGVVVGVARVTFAHAWAGVSAVNVAPAHRRTGVALQLMAAVGEAARARGIRSVYLQVAQANSAALALYERLGFVTHHEYVYLGART